MTRRPSLEGKLARLKLCWVYVSQIVFVVATACGSETRAAQVVSMTASAYPGATIGLIGMYLRCHTPPKLYRHRNPGPSTLATPVA